jgi:hypothetical protein
MGCWNRAYTTACSPDAPPQPMSTMEKVNVEITKLFGVQYGTVNQKALYDVQTHPRKPKGVAFAYCPTRSWACGVLGARYSFSKSSGLMEMLVEACFICGSFSILSESVLIEVCTGCAVVAVVVAILEVVVLAEMMRGALGSTSTLRFIRFIES